MKKMKEWALQASPSTPSISATNVVGISRMSSNIRTTTASSTSGGVGTITATVIGVAVAAAFAIMTIFIVAYKMKHRQQKQTMKQATSIPSGKETSSSSTLI